MGASRKECGTCGAKSIGDCPGHFGFYELDVPMYHLGFFGQVVMTLNCLCLVWTSIYFSTVVQLSYQLSLNNIMQVGCPIAFKEGRIESAKKSSRRLLPSARNKRNALIVLEQLKVATRNYKKWLDKLYIIIQDRMCMKILSLTVWRNFLTGTLKLNH